MQIHVQINILLLYGRQYNPSVQEVIHANQKVKQSKQFTFPPKWSKKTSYK